MNFKIIVTCYYEPKIKNNKKIQNPHEILVKDSRNDIRFNSFIGPKKRIQVEGFFNIGEKRHKKKSYNSKSPPIPQLLFF